MRLAVACILAVLVAPASHAALSPPRIPPYMTANPGPLKPSKAGRHEVFFIGDSLTQNSTYLLPALLPGWDMSVDAAGGRPLQVGTAILDQRELPADGSIVLVMALFTNNPPTQINLLKAAVRESLERAGPNGCVVWATIHRPPVDGHSYERVNEFLRATAVLDNHLRLMDWDRAVIRDRIRFNRTGVHPLRRGGARGWKLRARMTADAIRSC